MATDVERYYDANTRRFLRFGKGGGVGTIHRAVWAPGVANQREALHYIHTQLETEFRRRHAKDGYILDLGCGTGASMAWLASRLPYRFTGITISPVQAEIGRQRFSSAYGDRLSIEVGDFAAAPFYERVRSSANASAGASGIYMIESLAHANDPGEVIRLAGSAARPGALFAVCDDIVEDDFPNDRRETLQRYLDGWHIGSVITPSTIQANADAAGFSLVANHDLTRYTAMNRPRDRLARLLLKLPHRPRSSSPWWDNLIGGTALQDLELKGHLRYRLILFEKR